MTIDNLIDQFVEDLNFKLLANLANIFNVEHDKESWLDDEWPDKVDELRVAVGEAMKNISKKG